MFSVLRYGKHFEESTTKATMLELFIELTDQIFWDGYAQQLAAESPVLFQQEFNDFLDNYNN